jgi:Anaphase-promoting complex, cyclosome, subunit 4
VCQDSWMRDAIGGLTKSIVDPLAKLSVDHAEDSLGSPWELLNVAFCGGGVAGAVEQFLASSLSEAGAKEVLRVFSSASDQVRETVAAALPLAQRLVFRASEYRGLARFNSRFGRIGVAVATVDRVFCAAQQVFEKLGMLAIEINQTDKHTRAFLRWLIVASAQAAGEESGTPRAASDTPASPAIVDDPTLVSVFFEDALSSEGDGGIYPSVAELYHDFAFSALEAFKVALSDLLALPSRSISAALTSSLSQTIKGSPHTSVVIPRISGGHVSLICREGNAINDGNRGCFEALYMRDAEHMSILRYHYQLEHLLSSNANPWTVANVKIALGGQIIRSVSHGTAGDICVVACETGINSDKVCFVLGTRELPRDLVFSGIYGDAKHLPLAGEGWAVEDLRNTVEFCTAAVDSACLLHVEPRIYLATVQVGANRIVVLNLGQPAAAAHSTG